MRRTLLIGLILLFLMPIAICEDADDLFHDAPQQVVMTFLGDCTLGSTPLVRDSEDSFVSYIDRFGMDYPFSGVIDILKKDDLTVANLEGVFYNHEANRVEKTYNFRAETSFAEILPLSSIEAVSFANNHTADYGERGYRSTIQALDEFGVKHFGTNEFDSVSYIYEKGNIRIGFAAVNITVFNRDRSVFRHVMEDLDAQGVAMTIVCMHGGIAYDRRHDTSQDSMVSVFMKNGAEIIIGNHPHVVQGMMVNNGRSCLYSLGNFSFGGNKKLRAATCIMAQITLSFDEEGQYLGHQINIIPCSPSSNSEFNDYRPVPLTGKAAERVIEQVQYDTEFEVKPYIEGVGAVQDFIPAPVPTPSPTAKP